MLEIVKKYALLAVVVILAANVLFLDWKVLFNSRVPIIQNINVGSSPAPQSDTTKNTTQTTQSTIESPVVQNSCPVSCLGVIKEATSSVKTVENVTNNTTQVVQAQAPSEYFIPLGSGSSSSNTWTNLGGVAAQVDISQYPNVQTVYFEVTVFVPTGNEQVWVQLYDATDGYVIPGSQVTMTGGTAQLLTSSNLNLPAGNKLYQVQMLTQLTYPAIVQQARLHITTQ